MNRAGKFFTEGLVPREIKGFPYPTRNCRHCEREMVLEASIHLDAEPEHFKSLFICDNPKCPALLQEPYKAHAYVYYASAHAFDKLQLSRILYQRDEAKTEKVYFS